MSFVATGSKSGLEETSFVRSSKHVFVEYVSGDCIRRKVRRLWQVGIPLALFFYVGFYCTSMIWATFNINTHPLDNIITGSGFSKLPGEQTRLAEKLHHGVKLQRLPQCIIIGVGKCGTRALLEFLDLHQDVEIARQEVHFFSDKDKYLQGLDWYLSKMPFTLSHQYTVEKSPGYFIKQNVPERIKMINSSMKLVVILRNPTTRALSDYTQVYFNNLAKNKTIDDFEKVILDPFTGEINVNYYAIKFSIYHQFFPSWFNNFPKEQIHIVDGDNLMVDPVAEISKVEDFLGIENRITYDTLYFNSTRGFYCMRVNKTTKRCLGASKGRKHPDLEPNVIKKLSNFFQPHNERLYQMLNRRFNWS